MNDRRQQIIEGFELFTKKAFGSTEMPLEAELIAFAAMMHEAREFMPLSVLSPAAFLELLEVSRHRNQAKRYSDANFYVTKTEL